MDRNIPLRRPGCEHIINGFCQVGMTSVIIEQEISSIGNQVAFFQNIENFQGGLREIAVNVDKAEFRGLACSQ
jgi:hypothetical protein